MKYAKIITTAGFAMFAMFFGSANLVFPLVMGTQSGDHAGYTTLGLLISGVLVPFLGILGVVLYSGNRSNFFNAIGRVPAYILSLIILSLLGPFGVVPRCILVAYGGVELFLPQLPFELFSFIFCVTTLLIAWQHDRIIPIVGRILTPWLLISILTIILFGFIFSPDIHESHLSGLEAFTFGLKEGYQTMDLLAAFFFSATTVQYLKSHLRSDDPKKLLFRLSLGSSLIGGTLLACIYIAFVFLGALYAPNLANVEPQQMLAAIAGFTLGPFAIPIASISICFACLTTATVLAMLFADFVDESLPLSNINSHTSLVLTILISFIISFISFDTLKMFLGRILEIAYPALIMFSIGNIMHKLWGFHLSKYFFWFTLVISSIFYLIY